LPKVLSQSPLTLTLSLEGRGEDKGKKTFGNWYKKGERYNLLETLR
jgi:hypothetical protein